MLCWKISENWVWPGRKCIGNFANVIFLWVSSSEMGTFMEKKSNFLWEKHLMDQVCVCVCGGGGGGGREGGEGEGRGGGGEVSKAHQLLPPPAGSLLQGNFAGLALAHLPTSEFLVNIYLAACSHGSGTKRIFGVKPGHFFLGVFLHLPLPRSFHSMRRNEDPVSSKRIVPYVLILIWVETSFVGHSNTASTSAVPVRQQWGVHILKRPMIILR